VRWGGLLGLLCVCGTLARAEGPPPPAESAAAHSEPAQASPEPVPAHFEPVPPSALPTAPRATLPADAPLRRSYLVPAIEVAGLNLGLFAFHNLVSREPFALISWETMRGHLDGSDGWTFDVDKFVTNQLAHPYHGSVAFAAARSSGVPFWQAGLYTFFSSLTWEYFGENEPPAINDQITTTLGGVFLGEVLHRTYRLLVEEGGGKVPLSRRLAGVLVSPASSLNDWLFDGQLSPGDIDRAPPLYAELSPGVSLMTRLADTTSGTPFPLLREGPQFSLAGELVYGAPGDPRWRYRHPFSYFDATASVTFPGISMANLHIRGLAAGAQYGGETSPVRGLWGLFGLYDFGANNVVRVSSVGVGFGTTLHLRMSDESFLQGTAILGGLGFAAAGSLGLDAALVRDYHIGPGVQALVEAKLVRRGMGMLRVRANNWLVTGAYTEPREGFESITYVTWDGRVRVAPHLAVGFEVPMAWRVYDFGPAGPALRRAISGGGLRFTVSYMSDDIFGTAAP
jgi:hypothetical protein